MTTALQDLLEWFDQYCHNYLEPPPHDIMKDKINSLMPKEMDTHKDALLEGFSATDDILEDERRFKKLFPTHPTNKP